MPVVSKMAMTGGGGALLRAYCLAQRAIRNSGHAPKFIVRPGQLASNRIRDSAHFYFFAIGTAPFWIAAFIQTVVFGPCELRDPPEDGSEPRHWQFERTILRQLYARYFGFSDMEHYERNLSMQEREATISRWRRIENRVKHLQGERFDYKAWYHKPVSAAWVESARWRAERTRDNKDNFRHNLT